MAIITLTFDIEALDYIEDNMGDFELGLNHEVGESYVTVTKQFDHEPESWEHAADMFNLTEVADSIIYCEVE